MLDIYRAIGLEKIVETDNLLEKLNQDIIDNYRYVIPGYSCDYYLRTFPGEIEFEQCRDINGSILGTDIHFSGYNKIHLIFDSVISDNGTVHYYMVHGTKSPDMFPIRVICPDIHAGPKAGDKLYGQIVAFSSEKISTITKEEAEGGYVRDNGNGNVIIAGEIASIDKWKFEFEDIHTDFYELELETQIGLISVVVSKDNIANPEVETYISCEALLSYDIAIKPIDFNNEPFAKNAKDVYSEASFDIEKEYGYGFIPNYKNAERLLVNCIEHKSFERFSRTCSNTVILHTESDEKIIDNAEIAKTFSAITPELPVRCKIMHILSSNINKLIGKNAIVVEGEAGQLTAFSFSINKNGYVDEIRQSNPQNCVFGYDDELHALTMLEQGMCDCKNEPLREYLSEKCIYRSDYADRMSIGARRIIDRLNFVASNLNETNQYTFEIIPSCEALRTQTDLPDIYKGKWCAVEYQGNKLAAVVFIQINEESKITNVLLSRNGNYLKAFEKKESSEAIISDEPVNVKELLSRFYGKEDTLKRMRNNETPGENEGEVYAWKESDEFIRSWLNMQNYSVTDTEIEDDCIGYACTRKNKDYAVYMYTYGKQRSIHLDADYCQRLCSYPLSDHRMIIIVYLKVDGFEGEDGQWKYQVGRFSNSADSPEMWTLHKVEGRNILLFYPRQEVFEMVSRFMTAYNTQNLDLLKAICADEVSLEFFDGGKFYNDGFYSSLSRHFEHYGKMKTAYVRYNDVLFSMVPYLEDYCYISFSVTPETDRICNVVENTLDEGFKELLITDIVPEADAKNDYPLIEKVEYLPSDEIARFSAKLFFNNGETRRYNFIPSNSQMVNSERASDKDYEICQIKGFCFTDRMFSHGKLVDHIELPDWMGYRNYPQRGQGISFVNGFSISTAELYFNSYPIEEFCYVGMDDVRVMQFDYADDGFGVGRIGNLDPQNPLYLLDKNTMRAKVIPLEYQDTSICLLPFCGGYSEGLIMVSKMNDLALQYHHNLSSCAGMWGWLDKDFHEKIPPKYIFAKNFENGRAIVCKGTWSVNEDNRYWCEHEHWGVINQNEDEIVPCQFDELYEIDGTDRLYFVHEGGWDNGYYAIYDCVERKVILTLDFDFDMGYMFNECFVTEDDILVFDEHLPGEGKDLITAFDLKTGEYIAHQEENAERTCNGEKTITVRNEQTGEDIIVF